MLSLTSKTAIKAVIYLASKHESGMNSGVKEVAENIAASEHTVGKLLQTLVRHGIINSLKGPSGGFNISKNQLNKPIISIVEAIDGKQVFRVCGLGLSKCSARHPCPIHDEYKVARDILEKLFSSRRIHELCEPVSLRLAYLVG